MEEGDNPFFPTVTRLAPWHTSSTQPVAEVALQPSLPSTDKRNQANWGSANGFLSVPEIRWDPYIQSVC
jgi:hypothetical protein